MKREKSIININMGIDSMAKSYLAVNSKGVTFMMESGKKHFPDSELLGRAGNIPSVELKRYPLKEGGFAEEFVQAVITGDNGKKLHFLGLKTPLRNMIWPSSKIRNRVFGSIAEKKK